jgi:hypothetical protein
VSLGRFFRDQIEQRMGAADARTRIPVAAPGGAR